MALQQPDFAKMPCLAVDFNDKDLLGVEMLQTASHVRNSLQSSLGARNEQMECQETMAKLQAFSNSQQISGPSRSLILLDADGKAPLWTLGAGWMIWMLVSCSKCKNQRPERWQLT